MKRNNVWRIGRKKELVRLELVEKILHHRFALLKRKGRAVVIENGLQKRLSLEASLLESHLHAATVGRGGEKCAIEVSVAHKWLYFLIFSFKSNHFCA